MTLNDIILGALAQLDRGQDEETVSIWWNKLARFANDGIADLAMQIKPRRKENVTLSGGLAGTAQFNTALLARRCVKVLAIRENGLELAFSRAKETGFVRIPDASPGAGVELEYRFLPDEISEAADVPELPELCHALIITYTVARERASGDVNLQRGGNIYFQMYENGKKGLKRHLGENGVYSISKRW